MLYKSDTIEVTRSLLAAGADPNRGKWNWTDGQLVHTTPIEEKLSYTSEYGVRNAEALIEAGAEFEPTEKLMMAFLTYGFCDRALKWIDDGIDVNARSPSN